MACIYDQDLLRRLNIESRRVTMLYAELTARYLGRKYASERGREYATHGFCRRMGVLIHVVNRIFEVLPPEREDIPSRAEVMDATLAIQSFVINLFGCLDNLAWVWVYEKEVKGEDGKDLPFRSVGLLSKKVRSTYSPDFRSYLDERSEWFGYVTRFRDALAHRIPLYIPPYTVKPDKVSELQRLDQALVEADRRLDLRESERLRAEQEKLGVFYPLMTGSIFEKSPGVYFHPQLISDFMTIDELGRKMMDELEARAKA
jgi:hypothetical protein